jgi:hypothetical protein
MTAERAFNKLKAFRAVALRTDKREFVFQGTIDIASINMWLRPPSWPRSDRHGLVANHLDFLCWIGLPGEAIGDSSSVIEESVLGSLA